ncbi:MAG: DoxX family protein [Crocinitomicaceae bacterium]
MSKSKSLQPKATVAGRSFILNALLICINCIGLAFLVMGYHKNFESNALLYKILGNSILLISIAGLILFKGRIMMNNVSRVLVGGLFIVSGLVKANDPLGFAYKLEEYFEDGALAYRIKEWFGMPDFSLEFFIPFALSLSVIICVVEIVLGVLTIFGLKMKWVATLLMAMMLFFTFLTWHTANCDGAKLFKDRDTYAASNSVAKEKMESAKTNKLITIVSNDGKNVVIDEMRQPQCVDDCGCFGDALKGSVGRSLSPKESLWKDVILTYFVFWIFLAAFKRGTVAEENKSPFWFGGMAVIIFFSWVFGWFFPVFFGLVALMGSAWIFRSTNKSIPKQWLISGFVVLLCSLMVTYVLMYDPIKDYRPYAVGSNLKIKMNDGQEGKYLSLLVYKNSKTGEEREYDASSKEYIDSKIWENTNWKYLAMTQKEIIPVRIPSITEQFNPYLPLDGLSKVERAMPFIQEQLEATKMTGLLLLDKIGESKMEVPLLEYTLEDYPAEEFEIMDTIQMTNTEFKEVSARDFILSSKAILILSAKNLRMANFSDIERYKSIYAKAKADGIPMIMIVSSNMEEINSFRKKHNFYLPIFLNDETELKAVSRSNPALLVVKSGTVKGKYPHRSTPSYDWLKSNIIK